MSYWTSKMTTFFRFLFFVQKREPHNYHVFYEFGTNSKKWLNYQRNNKHNYRPTQQVTQDGTPRFNWCHCQLQCSGWCLGVLKDDSQEVLSWWRLSVPRQLMTKSMKNLSQWSPLEKRKTFAVGQGMLHALDAIHMENVGKNENFVTTSSLSASSSKSLHQPRWFYYGKLPFIRYVKTQ